MSGLEAATAGGVQARGGSARHGVNGFCGPESWRWHSLLGFGGFLYPFFLQSVPSTGMMAHATTHRCFLSCCSGYAWRQFSPV